jgi:ribosomal protein S18 acetylase RimI-like enzyme
LQRPPIRRRSKPSSERPIASTSTGSEKSQGRCWTTTLIQQGRVYVLDEAGDINGLVVVIPEARTMLLDNVAVSPEAQGKGYGRWLIALAEEEARCRGFETIRLYTNTAMTENISLYERLGNIETRRGEEDAFSRIYMEKLLGDDAH